MYFNPLTRVYNCQLSKVQPHFNLGGIAHHLEIPGRLEGQTQGNAFHPFNLRHLFLHLHGQRLRYRAVGSGEGHQDIDNIIFLNFNLINKAQIPDIHWNLRVINSGQYFNDLLFLQRHLPLLIWHQNRIVKQKMVNLL